MAKKKQANRILDYPPARHLAELNPHFQPNALCFLFQRKMHAPCSNEKQRVNPRHKIRFGYNHTKNGQHVVRRRSVDQCCMLIATSSRIGGGAKSG